MRTLAECEAQIADLEARAHWLEGQSRGAPGAGCRRKRPSDVNYVLTEWI